MATGTLAIARAIGSGESLGREELRAVALRSRPCPSRLDAPISSLRGAGPKLAAAAAEIGIETLGDLLLHVPHGHRDHSDVREVADLMIGEQATVRVNVRSARVRPTRRRNLRLVEANVADASGPLKAVWFNQAYLVERLTPGTTLLLNGKLDRSGFRVSTHEFVAGGAPSTGLHTTGIVPVHNATARLSAKLLRDWIWQAVARASDAIESLPAELRVRRGLASEADALRSAHFPDSPEEAASARDRLAFEELCLHQAALAMRRDTRRRSRPGIMIGPPGELVAGWLRSLPFELTGDQRNALDEIDADLATGKPMQRLLMGEVGVG